MVEAKGVEAVERALLILGAFGPDDQQLSLAELARRTGLYKSTLLRLAVSLQKYGYLVRSDTGFFRLGPMTWRVGSLYRQGFRLPDMIRAELRVLSDATSETASFYVREGDMRVCLYRSEPARSIRHTVIEGKTVPLAQGASGKILLAFSDEKAAEAEVREQGYAVSYGERDGEVAALAVPVISQAGQLMGALSVSGLITRFEAARIPALLALVQQSQRRIIKYLVD